MTGRPCVHAAAAIATMSLAACWFATSPTLAIARGLALLVVILYLIFVLITIAVENFRQTSSSSGDLWDHELDQGLPKDPFLDNPGHLD